MNSKPKILKPFQIKIKHGTISMITDNIYFYHFLTQFLQ